MSAETLEWLNRNILVGYEDVRGQAWHYMASDQGDEPNHYARAIPIEDVVRRLFHWQAATRRVAVEVPADIETMTHLGEDGTPMRWAAQDDRQAITRNDDETVMGMFKDSYKIHQYEEWLLKNVAHLVDGDLAIGSAGLLAGGAVAFVTLEMEDVVHTPSGLDFRPYLVACTSFDGSLATTYKRTMGIPVCDNTLAGALGEKGQQVKIRHSKYSAFNPANTQQALNIMAEGVDEFQEQVAMLHAIPVTDDDWKRFLSAHVELPEEEGRKRTIAENKTADLNNLWNNDPRVSPWKGTGLGVLQAVNTQRLHNQTVRGTGRVERNFLNMVKGTGYDDDALAIATLQDVLTVTR